MLLCLMCAKHRLWVIGELTAEAKSMIAAAQARAELKGYSIRVFYASDLDQQVSLVREPSLRKVVDQHFLHAPMAFSDAVINPLSKRSVPQSLFDFEDVDTEAAVTLPATTLHDLPARDEFTRNRELP